MRLDALQVELAQLRLELERDELCDGVLALGDVRVPAAYCDDGGDDDGGGGGDSDTTTMQLPRYTVTPAAWSGMVATAADGTPACTASTSTGVDAATATATATAAAAWTGPVTVDALVHGAEPGYTTPIVVRLHIPHDYPDRPAQPQFLNKLQHFTVDPGTGRPNPQLFDSAFQQLQAHAQAEAEAEAEAQAQARAQAQAQDAVADQEEAREVVNARASVGSSQAQQGSLRVSLQLIHIFLSQPLHVSAAQSSNLICHARVCAHTRILTNVAWFAPTLLSAPTAAVRTLQPCLRFRRRGACSAGECVRAFRWRRGHRRCVEWHARANIGAARDRHGRGSGRIRVS